MYQCIWETCFICYCTMPFKCISYYQYLVVIIIKSHDSVVVCCLWAHSPSSDCIYIKIELYFKLLSFTNLNQHTLLFFIIEVMIIYY